VSDLKLRDDILHEIAREPFVDAAHIGVVVDGDVVTLTGHVGTYAQKVAAVAAARRVNGVHGIADEIEVRYPFEQKTTDDEIARHALDLLVRDSVIPGDAIQVTVREGLVTLTGQVDRYDQKVNAEEDVRRLPDVLDVVNKIAIKPHPKTEDVKR
jgi:osmotically-inducible protein OsmY